MTVKALPALVMTALTISACGLGVRGGGGPVVAATPGLVAGAAYAVGTTQWSYVDTSRTTDASSRGGGVLPSRTLVTTIWYPAQGSPGVQAGADAAPANGVFPVVLFSHGLRGTPDDYASLLSHWAAFGFVVAAPAYPLTNGDAQAIVPGDLKNQPADASFVLGQVLSTTGALSGHLDAQKVAAAGHSEGALTTVGLFSTCCRDSRLRAGVILSGDSAGFESGLSGVPAPLLFVHGDQDHLIPIALDRRTFEAAPWPKAFLTLKGEGHIDPYLKEPDPAFAITAAATTDFLRWSLNGDPKALADLRTAAQVLGKTSLDDQIGS
jgi:fermentation-respiration switch protein FrsA (DUF1100 family)